MTVDGKAHEVYLCASEDFKEKSESKIALDAYKELEALPDESALEFCTHMGWEDYVCYNVNRPDKACQPVMLFLDSHLSYNGREIGLTRLLMD